MPHPIVTVKALPTVNAGLSKLQCIGDTTTLNATGGAGMYTWSPSAYFVNNSGRQVVAIVPPTTGNYICEVVLADTTTGCANNDTLTITVVKELIANAGADVSICSGASTTLSGSGGATFAWSPLRCARHQAHTVTRPPSVNAMHF